MKQRPSTSRCAMCGSRPIRAELEGKSREEEIAHLRAGEDEFQRRIEAARNVGQERTEAK